MISAFFCDRNEMYNRYPFCRKSVFLLPLAYVCRGIDSLVKLKSGEVRPFVLNTESEKQYSDVTQRRSKLFEDLGIL